MTAQMKVWFTKFLKHFFSHNVTVKEMNKVPHVTIGTSWKYGPVLVTSASESSLFSVHICSWQMAASHKARYYENVGIQQTNIDRHVRAGLLQKNQRLFYRRRATWLESPWSMDQVCTNRVKKSILTRFTRANFVLMYGRVQTWQFSEDFSEEVGAQLEKIDRDLSCSEIFIDAERIHFAWARLVHPWHEYELAVYARLHIRFARFLAPLTQECIKS